MRPDSPPFTGSLRQSLPYGFADTPANPRPAKPTNSIAQVEGSGMPGVMITPDVFESERQKGASLMTIGVKNTSIEFCPAGNTAEGEIDVRHAMHTGVLPDQCTIDFVNERGRHLTQAGTQQPPAQPE